MNMYKIVINKIEGSTPSDMFEISEYIDSLPDDKRESAVEVLCMTWNFLAECVKNGSEYGGDSCEHLDDCYDDRNEDGTSDLPYGMNV